MQLKMFALFDSAAMSYSRPFFCLRTEEAVRDFKEGVNRKGNPTCTFAADFTLFELGSYDQGTGRFTELKAHINLGNGVDHRDQVVAMAVDEPSPFGKEASGGR